MIDLTGISGFLANKLVAPIAIAVAVLSLLGNAGLGLLYWSATRTIGTLSTSNTQLAGDLRTCQSNSKLLEASVATQNAGVDSLAKDAELAAANAKLAQSQKELVAARHDADAAALNKLPPLAPDADHCAAASQLIRDTIAGELTNGI